jgi:hypothetical protein
VNADYPGAIVVEAANYGYGVPNRPKRWGFHTPEEPADSYPSTPDYLATTDRDASYTYFASTLGFIFQLVPESQGAYAHGLDGKPAPFWSDGTNLNLQSLSLSFEGHAATIHLTMPRGSPQWNAAVDLVAHRTKALGLDLDSSFQHKDVSIYRSDCGQWDQAAFIADVIAKMEEDMAWTEAEKEHVENITTQIDELRKTLGLGPAFGHSLPPATDLLKQLANVKAVVAQNTEQHQNPEKHVRLPNGGGRHKHGLYTFEHPLETQEAG